MVEFGEGPGYHRTGCQTSPNTVSLALTGGWGPAFQPRSLCLETVLWFLGRHCSGAAAGDVTVALGSQFIRQVSVAD